MTNRHQLSAISYQLILTLTLSAFAGTAFAQEGVRKDETGILPEGWSIEEEVKHLEGSVRDFGVLIKSLGSANTELQELLAKHLKNPGDRLVSSQLEKKIASYGSDAVRDFDRIISMQDGTLSNFRALNRKLNRFNGYVGAKLDAIKGNADDVKKDADKMEKELEELASTVKNSTGDDQKASKAKFARTYQKYKIQKRYAEGYGKNFEGYQKLSSQLLKMNEMFALLREKFSTLIENLENEKKFLMENMNLQEDSMRVKVLIRDGVLSGQEALGKVTEKMAALFLKVDAFNKINERVSGNLDGFMEFQQTMVGITDQLNKIGAIGDPKTLDDAIDDFYKRRNGEK